MFAQLFAIIAPIVICAGIGFWWEKTKRPFDNDFITSMVSLVGTPGLIFYSLSKLEVSLEALGEMALAAAISIFIFMAIGFVALKLMGRSVRTFLPSLCLPNTGNMGLPLCLFAFGDEGLALAIAYFAVMAFLGFIIGPMLASGSADFRKLLKMPIFYAMALALVFLVGGYDVPKWLYNTAFLLGGISIPLVLISLGVSIARLRVTAFQTAVIMGLIRTGGGFLVGISLAEAFSMTGTAWGVFVLQCAMPVAVYNYLFALMYDAEPDQVASVVVVSTVLSFVTMPLLLLVVL